MHRRVAVVVVALAVLGAARSLTAHHSFAAQYDRDKPITLQGTVTRIEWMNPHVYFYIDVTEGPTVAHWAIEGGAPTSLYRAAMGGLVDAAREVKEKGTFGYVDTSIATPDLASFMAS